MQEPKLPASLMTCVQRDFTSYIGQLLLERLLFKLRIMDFDSLSKEKQLETGIQVIEAIYKGYSRVTLQRKRVRFALQMALNDGCTEATTLLNSHVSISLNYMSEMNPITDRALKVIFEKPNTVFIPYIITGSTSATLLLTFTNEHAIELGKLLLEQMTGLKNHDPTMNNDKKMAVQELFSLILKITSASLKETMQEEINYTQSEFTAILEKHQIKDKKDAYLHPNKFFSCESTLVVGETTMPFTIYTLLDSYSEQLSAVAHHGSTKAEPLEEKPPVIISEKTGNVMGDIEEFAKQVPIPNDAISTTLRAMNKTSFEGFTYLELCHFNQLLIDKNCPGISNNKRKNILANIAHITGFSHEPEKKKVEVKPEEKKEEKDKEPKQKKAAKK